MKFVVALGILSLLVSVADGGVSMHDPFYCYSTDTIRSGNSFMAGPTSYEAIRRINFTTVNPYTAAGTPSRFWYLGRCGARLPHPEYIQGMLDFAESSNHKLAEIDQQRAVGLREIKTHKRPTYKKKF